MSGFRMWWQWYPQPIGAPSRLLGVEWHAAEPRYDTVNRIALGLWFGWVRAAWWPKWASPSGNPVLGSPKEENTQ